MRAPRRAHPCGAPNERPRGPSRLLEGGWGCKLRLAGRQQRLRPAASRRMLGGGGVAKHAGRGARRPPGSRERAAAEAAASARVPTSPAAARGGLRGSSSYGSLTEQDLTSGHLWGLPREGRAGREPKSFSGSGPKPKAGVSPSSVPGVRVRANPNSTRLRIPDREIRGPPFIRGGTKTSKERACLGRTVEPGEAALSPGARFAARAPRRYISDGCYL